MLLNARRITDHCVYFTPAGADDLTTIRCEMTQERHALIAKKIVKPGEELDCQIGLIMANIHEALAAKGVPDSAAKAAVFKLLKQWNLRNNPSSASWKCARRPGWGSPCLSAANRTPSGCTSIGVGT